MGEYNLPCERNQWEKRADRHGGQLNGVLFKGFSHPLNQYLDQGHTRIVAEQLLPHLPKGAWLLDLGCGYGRISEYIHKVRPDICLTGLDFTFAYCQRYRNHLKAYAVCADLTRLPLAHLRFDAVVAVTALMYIPLEQREMVFTNVFDLLRPGGMMLSIEPGAEYLNMVNRIRPSSSSTGGRGFNWLDYRRFGSIDSMSIRTSGGFPGFSALLPLLYLLHIWPSALYPLLRLGEWLDRLPYSNGRFSLHRWMLLQKEAADWEEDRPVV